MKEHGMEEHNFGNIDENLLLTSSCGLQLMNLQSYGEHGGQSLSN